MNAVINKIADAPDPTARFKVFVEELRRRLLDDLNTDESLLLDELEEKAALFAAAIVSGGHIHEMSMTFEGRASV